MEVEVPDMVKVRVSRSDLDIATAKGLRHLHCLIGSYSSTCFGGLERLDSSRRTNHRCFLSCGFSTHTTSYPLLVPIYKE